MWVFGKANTISRFSLRLKNSTKMNPRKANYVDVFKGLAIPFAPDRVSWRVGSTTKDKTKGLALAYIDARDVMQRLDEVIGPDNWQDRYEVHGGKTICYISIRVGEGETARWVVKADGAGDSDIEAEKGAISDAFKRAAVKWGIGRYLYDLDSPWILLDTYQGSDGKTYVKGIKAEEMGKLRASLNAADPEARATIWAQSNAKFIKQAMAYPGAAEIFSAEGVRIDEQ